MRKTRAASASPPCAGSWRSAGPSTTAGSRPGPPRQPGSRPKTSSPGRSGIHAASRGAYGAPRVHAKLRRTGRRVNRKKVERIMRERDIRGITRRKRRNLTKADTKAAPSPDLVGRDFTAAEPGRKLVGDITYLPTLEGWWYLAAVIDLATREVIGYAMADHHRASLVTDAIRMAAGRGELKPGCIMRTDRGSEYTSREFRTEIRKLTTDRPPSARSSSASPRSPPPPAPALVS
ncbi:IS3 family transposase [Streptomyces sp. NPDC002730]|uniref:IS3 family transposase n=1 Tax=Streptomyces sp. NPDC002730 TaxID=3364662 RepID=UPI0036CD3F1D